MEKIRFFLHCKELEHRALVRGCEDLWTGVMQVEWKYQLRMIFNIPSNSNHFRIL